MSNLPDTHPEGAARLFVLDEFNKTNDSKITVNLDDGKAITDLPKFKSLAAGGTPPDLYFAGYFDPGDLYTIGSIIEVDGELKKEKDWAKQRADIFPAILETSLWAGKLVSVPAYTNNQGMIYNTALLQQASVAPPKQGWTWDDFRTTALKFVRPGVIPLSMGWGHTWNHWLGSTGSRIISKDGRKMQVDTPEMLSVMELYLDLLSRGIAQANPEGTAGLFETYRLAKNDTVFEVQGPYRIPTLRQASVPEFATVHIPVHPAKKQITAVNGGHSLVISKGTPEKMYAGALVAKWVNTPAAQTQACIRSLSVPVSKGAMESKEMVEYLKTDPAYKGFVDLSPYGWRWPPLPSQGKISKAVEDQVTAILRKQVGAKAGLATAQREAQLFLDEDVKLMK